MAALFLGEIILLRAIQYILQFVYNTFDFFTPEPNIAVQNAKGYNCVCVGDEDTITHGRIMI